MKKYNDKFKTIRVRKEDYETLCSMSEKTEIKIVGLIHIALPLLKKKFDKENDDE